MVQRQACTETAQSAAQRAERGAPPEVAPAEAVGYELAHPRRPGIVPGHAQERARRGHGEKDRSLLRLRERHPGQKREQDRDLSRDSDGPERGAAAPVHLAEPSRGDLHQLRGERQGAEDAHQHRGEVEVERPRGDGAATRAGADDLGDDPFGGRGTERAAQRAS